MSLTGVAEEQNRQQNQKWSETILARQQRHGGLAKG